jgi:hypothetical protein
MDKNLHPVFQQALKPFMPETVQVVNSLSKMYDLGIDHALEIIKQEYITCKSLGEGVEINWQNLLSNISFRIQSLKNE